LNLRAARTDLKHEKRGRIGVATFL
jgi:hypothetical protein